MTSPMTSEMLADLRRSGLTDETIAEMRLQSIPKGADCRTLLGWDHTPGNGGYKIPYFDLDGRDTGFFRIRFVPALKKNDGGLTRYGQPKGTTTRAYLPPLASCRSAWRDPRVILCVTEGEKKAAKACQEGILTVGLGGVNSWMRRKFRCKTEKITPEGKDGEFSIISLLDSKEIQMMKERVAEDLLDLPFVGRHVYVCFDNDGEVNPQVQLAAFDFSTWLEERDAFNVVQILLPPRADGTKQGLDDYLLTHTADDFLELPKWRVVPDNLKGWLREQLDGTKKLGRSGVIACGRAVSNSLLNKGKTFRDADTSTLYYHSSEQHDMHAFDVHPEALKHLGSSTFGALLHRSYGLGAPDSAVLARTFENLAHNPEIQHVTPRRISHTTDKALYYQLSDSEVIRTNARSIALVPNGTDGVVFLSGQVNADEDDAAEVRNLFSIRPELPPLWLGAVEELLTLQPLSGLTLAETRLFLAALCYLNPWFRRWRGLALPIEIFCAEPNSGKSYLLMLRRGILTGRQDLDLMSEDKGDWYADITHAPGIWVGDNVDQLSRDMERTLSDALCYFVTQDDPKITLRKLYATNVKYQARVDCTFAFTCIRNPFHKPDILQRSFTFPMKAIPVDKRKAGWVDTKLQNRALWLYDQMRVSRRFLRAAESDWSATAEQSSTRLKYFDQALLLMGKALGRADEMAALIPKLRATIRETIADSDPMMMALRAFWENEKGKGRVGAAYRWQSNQIRLRLLETPDDRWEHVRVIKSQEAFGRYLAQHESDIFHSAGMKRFVEKNQTWIELREEID
jgi:hypothetical protein